MSRFFTITYYIFFISTGTFFVSISAIIWLFTFWWDKKLRAVHIFTQLWSNILIYIVPTWKLNVIGKENINKNKTYVIVSNHQSEFDIPVASFLKIHFKWVSKAEVFKVPIIGWNMTLNNYIKLVRGNKRSIIHMIKDCGDSIRLGNSIYIFPEGTRSKTGVMRRFMSGAFVIAQREKIGILPVVINGTKNIMEKGSLSLNFKADISLKILKEIPYEEIKDKSAELVAENVRNLIEEHLDNN